MNISGIPQLVTLTVLSSKTPPENISIYEDDISTALWQRWIACVDVPVFKAVFSVKLCSCEVKK